MVKTNYSNLPPNKQLSLPVPPLPDKSRALALKIAANTWRAEGVSIVPAQPKSKVVRLSWRAYEETPADRDLIDRWFSNGKMNLAVICGTGGLLVLDFDELARFELWRKEAGQLARTYTEATSRGVHLFYKVDDPTTRRFSECEALGVGHLCLVHPSVHPSGSLYTCPNLDEPIKLVSTGELFSLLSALPTRYGSSVSTETVPAAGQERNDLVGRIKTARPILPYAQTLTELKPSGQDARWWVGKCPFHEDKEPSFWVDSQKGIWGCYKPTCSGARGGDLINLYALNNSIDVRESIRRLAREVLA